MVGAACFVLGALVEFKHNAHVRCATPVFWLCFWCRPACNPYAVRAATRGTRAATRGTRAAIPCTQAVIPCTEAATP